MASCRDCVHYEACEFNSFFMVENMEKKNLKNMKIQCL